MLIELLVEGSDEPSRIVAFFCSGCMLVEFLFSFFLFLSLSLSVWEKAVEGWKGGRVKLGDTQRQVFFWFFFSWSALLPYIRCHTLSLS